MKPGQDTNQGTDVKHLSFSSGFVFYPGFIEYQARGNKDNAYLKRAYPKRVLLYIRSRVNET